MLNPVSVNHSKPTASFRSNHRCKETINTSAEAAEAIDKDKHTSRNLEHEKQIHKINIPQKPITQKLLKTMIFSFPITSLHY